MNEVVTAPPGEGEALAARARVDRLKGIGLMCAALACFTALDTCAKWLSTELPTVQIVWVRFLLHMALAALVLNPVLFPSAWSVKRPWFQLARGLFLMGSTIGNFMALRTLQLAETMSIFFAGPFLIALLAGPLLGEWIGPRRWLAVMAGFLGILVITQPGFREIDVGILWSLGAVASYAFYALSTRVLNKTETASSMLIVSAAVPTVLMAPFIPGVWVTPAETLSWVLLAATGAFGAFGHFLLIRAHAYTPTAILAPFVYTQLLWMTGAGYLVFGDVPGANTLLGAGIVVASGLYLLYRERVTKGEG